MAREDVVDGREWAQQATACQVSCKDHVIFAHFEWIIVNLDEQEKNFEIEDEFLKNDALEEKEKMQQLFSKI